MKVQAPARFLAKLALRRQLRALRGLSLTAALGIGVFAGDSARAATITWLGTMDANWTTASNWSTGAVPGVNPVGNNNTTNPTVINNSTDTVLFNTDPANGNGTINPIIIDGTGNSSSNRMIGALLFDTGAGAYNIGAIGGTTTLQVGNGLSATMNAGVTNVETFNAPLALHLPSSTNGTFTVQNNATSSAATMVLAGGILDSTNSTRGTTWTLGGSNTGNNTVNGVITLNSNGAFNSSLIKAGTGRWVLSNASNVIRGGVTINGGTLATTNAGGVGIATTTINSGGTFEVDGVVLTNAQALNDGGAITGNGAAESVRLVTASATAANVTLGTVNATDTFTVGAAANGYTGGAATTVTHIAGPGTVALNQASNYVGTFSVDAGTLRLGNATALGSATTAGVTFGANSTGRLQINDNNVTLASLNSNAAPGTAVVENGGVNIAVLTVNNAAANTFGGTLQDGTAGGILSLTKGGAGTLTLSGTSTFSGPTTIGAGILNVTGTLSNNTSVAVNNGGTLAGGGIVAGAVTLASGGIISPGNGGTGTVGTLSVGNLTLNTGSQLNYDITNTTTLDRITVTGAGGLTINGGQFNLNGAANAFSANGVYNLIGYSGAIGGTGVSALTLNANNQNTSTNTYTFGTAGGFVTLTVAGNGVVADYWNVDANGNWGTASNWTSGVPNAAGAFASFGGGGATITAPRTVTVNGAFTVGTLAFNSSQAYTLAAGAGGQLTLDNGGSAAFVTDSAGSHFVQVPLAMTTNGATFTVSSATDTLAVSGLVSGTGGGLTKNGAGTLALTGANTYTGGTTINAGTLQINSASSLGDPSGAATLNAATLEATTDIVSARSFNLGSATSTILVDPGHTYTLNGVLSDGMSAGTLVKSGAGTLAITGTNGYTGSTTINAGTVQINNASALGNPSSGTVATIGPATLEATASFTMGGGFVLNDAATTIQTDTGVNYIMTGVLSGTGGLNKTGAGTLTITGANTYSGNTVISGGVINAGNGGTTGYLNGPSLTFQNGGTFTNGYNANNTYFLTQAITVAAGQTGNINMGNRMSLTGAVTGGGTLNINAATTVTRDDFSNNWAGFTGQLNVTGSGTIRLLNNGGGFNTGGLASTSVDLEGTVALQPSNNSTGNTYTIGALAGTATTTTLAAPSQGGATTWSIGGLNTNTTYNGLIANGNVTKVGTGTLTLTAANQYAGLTTISGGALNINGINALGGGNYAGLTINGGTLQYNAAAATANNGSLDVSNIGGTAKPVTFGALGATIDTNGNAVTFANTVGNAGTGGLTKIGMGTLTLAAANTYTGVTTINVGTLTIAANGALSTGNTTVAAGATLELGTGVTAAHSVNTTTMTLLGTNSLVMLDAAAGTVQDSVTTLVINGVTEPAGTYGGTGSNAGTIMPGFFTGTGVLAVVPEPSTWASLLGGMAGLAAWALRRRRVA